MNKTNFNQTGGFPLKTERLDELQKAYEIFNAFGAIAGNLVIISGCQINGTSVSDGYVYIDGELLPFKAGFISANVIIVENVSSKEFESGELKPVHFERFATFGTAETSWPWSSFIRPIETKTLASLLSQKEDKSTITALINRINTLEAKTSVFQSGGGMVLWNKPAAQIPPGWAEVVDWRGRMPVGFDTSQTEFNAIGKTGGTKSTTIQKTHLPPGSYGWIGDSGAGYPDGSNDDTTPGAPRSYPKVTKQLVLGNGTALPILNPYRTVLFIEWVGLT